MNVGGELRESFYIGIFKIEKQTRCVHGCKKRNECKTDAKLKQSEEEAYLVRHVYA